ncbi:hypothetical protein F4677DRAFT_414675 [Hypoxylon crocopeplum]|nr:hypothetical protein F4677DRAFT_414675 [Hypoxylon crocopeplum]
MDALLRQAKHEIDRFTAVTASQHFLMYIPYEGASLPDFVDSCFHRKVMRHIKSEEEGLGLGLGYTETAIFATPGRGSEGGLALLFSRGKVLFDMASCRNLHAAGAFDRAFGRDGEGPVLPCMALDKNILLVEGPRFYTPRRRWLEEYGSETGARRFSAYKRVMDGFYDRTNQRLTESRVPHNCVGNSWCQSSPPEIDFDQLFLHPWDNPSLAIVDAAPYRLLNILPSDLQHSSPSSSARRFSPRPGGPSSVEDSSPSESEHIGSVDLLHPLTSASTKGNEESDVGSSRLFELDLPGRLTSLNEDHQAVSAPIANGLPSSFPIKFRDLPDGEHHSLEDEAEESEPELSLGIDLVKRLMGNNFHGRPQQGDLGLSGKEDRQSTPDKSISADDSDEDMNVDEDESYVATVELHSREEIGGSNNHKRRRRMNETRRQKKKAYQKRLKALKRSRAPHEKSPADISADT